MKMLKVKFNNEIVYVGLDDNTNVKASKYIKNGSMLTMRDALPEAHPHSWESMAEYLMSKKGIEAIFEAMILENYENVI